MPVREPYLTRARFVRVLGVLALVLVGAAGFSYEEAADICGCAAGTIKSRVNRARNRLADMLGLDAEAEPEDIGAVSKTA